MAAAFGGGGGAGAGSSGLFSVMTNSDIEFEITTLIVSSSKKSTLYGISFEIRPFNTTAYDILDSISVMTKFHFPSIKQAHVSSRLASVFSSLPDFPAGEFPNGFLPSKDSAPTRAGIVLFPPPAFSPCGFLPFKCPQRVFAPVPVQALYRPLRLLRRHQKRFLLVQIFLQNPLRKAVAAEHLPLWAAEVV